jgi:hypothetical protein
MQVCLDMAPSALGRVARRTNPLIDKRDGAVHRLMTVDPGTPRGSPIIVVLGSIQSLLSAIKVPAVRLDTGTFRPSRAGHRRKCTGLFVGRPAPNMLQVCMCVTSAHIFLSERHSADEVGGCVSVCQDG